MSFMYKDFELLSKVVPINRAEAIFYPAFDKNLCDDSLISTVNATCVRSWDSLSINGGKEFSAIWNGKVSLKNNDKLICFLTMAGYVTMSGTAIIDGLEVEIFSSIKGANSPIEAVSCIINPKGADRILTKLILNFKSEKQENHIALSWFGLCASWNEHLIEDDIKVFDEKWEGFLNYNVVAQVEKNVLFIQAEAEELKREIINDEKAIKIINSNAQKWSSIRPEEQIREFAAVIEHLYRYVRVRDRNRIVLDEIVVDLAVAGYVLDEPKYSNLAARIILCLINTKWSEGPTCCFEGSDFHHVCFVEDHILSSVVIAMGFLGGLFTEKAIKLITEKVEENWKWVSFKCSEEGYRNFMNQGVVGNRGNMLGAYFLQLHKGGYESQVQKSYDLHTNVLGNYISEDGYCVEGVHYYEYSSVASVLVWHVYSRFINEPIEKVVPDRFLKSKDYVEAMLSSIDDKGAHIPVNCSNGEGINTLLLIFLTTICGFEKGQYYLKNRTEESVNSNPLDLLFLKYYERKIEYKEYINIENKNISFKEDGLATYTFRGGKLLFCVEGNPYTAHFHEDRGQIILEADGQILLPDLGTTNYSNIASGFMDKNEYHNIAHPVKLSMNIISEVGKNAAFEAGHNIIHKLTKEEMYTPTAKLLYGNITEDGYQFCGNTGMLYGENIKGIRKGTLEIKLKKLSIIDEWEFEEKQELMVQYISYGEWKIDGNTAICRVGNIALTVEFISDNEFDLVFDNSMIDWKLTTVFILRAKFKGNVHHFIKTNINWSVVDE